MLQKDIWNGLTNWVIDTANILENNPEKIQCIFYTKFLSSDFDNREKGNYIPTMQIWVVSKGSAKEETSCIKKEGDRLLELFDVHSQVKIAYANFQIEDHAMSVLLEQLTKGTIIYDRTGVFLKMQQEMKQEAIVQETKER